MSRSIIVRERAAQDLREQVSYIAQYDPDRSFQFFDSARQTFATLAKTPGIGRLYEVDSSYLQGLRKWAVKGFEKYLIFYLYGDDVIEIVRVLHAAQDTYRILERES